MSIGSLLGGELAGELASAPLETARFGVDIARLDIGPDAAATPEEILDAFERSEARILVLRYPAQHADWFAQLVRPPLRVLHADTLVYYRQDLQQVDPRAALRRGVITGGDALAEREIGSLVRTVFAGYGNHYRANPDLDADRSIDGYVEWTVNHVGDGSKALWVLAEHAGGDPIGFAAVTLEKTAEIDLAGVVPDHRGRGWYRDLLDHTAVLVLARGLREVWISTQASNAAAIRAWSSRGYRHEFTFNTVHIVK